ncbi:hypothetical protein ITP53_23170 [Nonomuraea sp. K274]|uniref:Serine/threonine protein kinase n=1 Tax=Nonomuraea cypriaca TaxID=1187855 RepID=A0A931AEG0_9ACTN|nr:hypothetical protein [Nonomuraea cypriaca]MBF8188575.1 hypothetical protein [Nonomuraea cypriaca]
MSRLGPVITLAAGAVLAVGLGVASVTAAPAANEEAAGTAAQAPAVEETTAEAPENTAEPSETTPEASGDTAEPSPSPAQTAPKKIVKADYGGRVKGNGALIAISIRNGKAVGYFCDGRIETWFKGQESAGELNLKGVANARSKVTAELAGGEAAGSVTVGGKKWSFVAPTVVKPSGLYRATAVVRGAKFRAGWIMIKNPNGGYYQVGTAFMNEEQLDVPELDSGQPTAPVTLEDTTLYPKDVDGFIEEMQ